MRARRDQGFWSFLEGIQSQVEPEELRQLALGLIFFRCLSEAFSERRDQLERETRNPRSIYFCLKEEQRQAMLERPSAYRNAKVVWVPPAARWERLQLAMERPNVGRAIDAAIISLELANPALKGLFPRDYARPELGREALVQLLEVVSRIGQDAPHPVPALSRLCEDVAGRARLKLVSEHHEPPREEPTKPFARLIQRLDDQLKELDRQLQQSQALRARTVRA